jgi:hypothetical protein
MHTRPLFALAAATLAALLATGADAQVRRITAVPQATRQAAPAGVATFGMPSPGGLASPAPASLTPPGAPSLTPPGSPNLSSPGTAPGSPAIDAGIAQPITAGGGAGVFIVQSGAGGGTNVMGGAPAPRGPLSAVDIARAFMDADINRDGELSRAEAQRLGTLPVPFDDLDRNHDGVLSRFEYDDAFR